VAHVAGPVTGNAAEALSGTPGKIYLPYLITSGVPLLVWAAVLTVLAFGLAEAIRWLRTRQLPEAAARQYRDQAAAFRDDLTGPERYWYWPPVVIRNVINHVAAQMPRDPIPSERVRQIVAGPGS
jgi:hypothetical protein